MKQRKWTVEEKLAIVLEGLKERRSIADICREHKISQTLYYRWRDKFLEAGKRGLINGSSDDNHYKAEIERLQKLIGKQAIQIEILKKNRGAIGNKIEVVEMLKGVGYTIKDACNALGISRSSYYSAKEVRVTEWAKGDLKDGELVRRIKEIKVVHPFWGYRRITAWLKHREGIKVNHKRVQRLMKRHGLLATQTTHKAKRRPQGSKPRAERPRQYWGIDMTKFMVSSIGWIYLVIVLDWYTKKIVGWNLSLRSRASEWKEAIEMAILREYPKGVRGSGLKLISDNGSQPTATSFMRDMATLGIEQIFTSYDNPKGNADTERVMRTIKEEIIWLNEFGSYEEAKEKIGKWIEEDYNKLYVHSQLGYMSPEEFEAKYEEERIKKAA